MFESFRHKNKPYRAVILRLFKCLLFKLKMHIIYLFKNNLLQSTVTNTSIVKFSTFYNLIKWKINLNYDKMKQSLMMWEAGLLHWALISAMFNQVHTKWQLTRVRPTLISSVFRITLKLVGLSKFILTKNWIEDRSVMITFHFEKEGCLQQKKESNFNDDFHIRPHST